MRPNPEPRLPSGVASLASTWTRATARSAHPWLSPLAVDADVVLPCTVTASSPFDALSPALALSEALIAAVTEWLGDAPRQRIERFESLQRDLAPQTDSDDGA